MRQLPGGTVTFLFTDIEGSTRLQERLGGGYAAVLAEQRRLLRAAVAGHNGVEVDTQGDSFFVVFARASDAVAAAVEAQHALARIPVLVRMGIHTSEPIVTSEGYVGMGVHLAARIMGAGHGGQVLPSEATRRLLPDSVALRDLGEHRLKDLGAPQRLYQLGVAGFPPLRTLYRTNLPIQPTAIVGRRRSSHGCSRGRRTRRCWSRAANLCRSTPSSAIRWSRCRRGGPLRGACTLGCAQFSTEPRRGRDLPAAGRAAPRDRACGRPRGAAEPVRAAGAARPQTAAPGHPLPRCTGKTANASQHDRVELRATRTARASAFLATRRVSGQLLARGGGGDLRR